MYKFGKKNPADIRAQEEVRKLAQEEAELAIKSAQECLRSPTFEKYRIEYENLEKLIIEELIFLDKTETDPVRYGFQAKDIVSKYRHVGALLRGVKADAHRRVVDNG